MRFIDSRLRRVINTIRIEDEEREVGEGDGDN